MSVPVKDRKTTTMKFLSLSRDLFIFTTRVTSAKVKQRKRKDGTSIEDTTVIPIRYRNASSELYKKSSDIRDYIMIANSIKVENISQAKERLKFQKQAIYETKQMMDKIDLLFDLIHFNKDIHKEWSKICYGLHKSLIGWHMSDDNKYHERFK